MPRPKSYKDLPRYMTARRSGGRLLYYYQAPGTKKRPLGPDKALALRQWAELEAQGVVGAGTFAVVAGHYERAVIPRKFEVDCCY